MTSLTLVMVAVVLYGFRNHHGYGRALALGGATPAGAALLAGQVAVPTFYAVSLGVVILLILGWIQQRPIRAQLTADRVPAGRALGVVLATGVVVTLLAPLLFDGLEVLSPTEVSPRLTAGLVTKSNIAQIVYLGLSVSVVVYLARSQATSVRLIGTAACIATLLSFWSWLHISTGAPFPVGLFDNSPSYQVQETLPGGAPRIRGIFSEPAGLAGSCLVTIAYCASRVRQTSGAHRWGLAGTCLAAVFLGSISTSTTFVVAGVALAAIAATVLGVGALNGRWRIGPWAVVGVWAASVAAVALAPVLARFVTDQVNSKLQTSSYDDRTGANDAAYQLVSDTYGFGVGLGSGRASSFLATALASIGIIGTTALAVAMAVILRRAWSDRSVRPAAWAFIAALTTKVIAAPDLSDSSGILWLTLGVLAHSTLHRIRGPQTPPADADTPSTTASNDVQQPSSTGNA